MTFDGFSNLSVKLSVICLYYICISALFITKTLFWHFYVRLIFVLFYFIKKVFPLCGVMTANCTKFSLVFGKNQGNAAS